MQKLKHFFSNLSFEFWFWLIVFFGFVAPNIYQYFTIQLTWHDTGVVYHMITNIFDFGYFYATDELLDHMSMHFGPFWFVLALPLKLFGMPFFVMLVSAACASICLSTYLISLQVVQNKKLALLIAIATAFNPYLSGINLYPHYEVFAVMFLMWFAYFSLKQKNLHALICFLFALTVKEDIWLYAAVMAFILFNRKQKFLLLGAAAAAVLYKILILGFLWDYLYPVKNGLFQSVWNYPVEGEVGVVLYLLQHLDESLPKIFTGNGFDYWVTFLFLPMLTPLRFVFIAGILFLWVNATAVDRNSLSYYYCYPILPLTLLALPYAFKNLEKFKNVQLPVAGLLVTLSLYFQFDLPRGLKRSPNNQRVFSKSIEKRDLLLLHIIDRYLTKDKESVFTQFPIASYIPKRKDFYVTYAYSKKVYAREVKPTYVLLDEKRWDTDESGVQIPVMIESFRKDPEYQLIRETDRIYLFKRL